MCVAAAFALSAPAFVHCAAAQTAPTAPAPAVDSGDVVKEIRIEGSRRIEPATVRSYLTIHLGDKFDPDKLDESLKALFTTGLFADVTLQIQGSTLIVHVVENPIVNRVAFEGNSKIEDKDLLQEIQLKPRTVYTRNKVQEDVRRILEVYHRSGRFGATVDPKIIQQSENRVDVVFEINEGEKTKVRRISFIGNHMFSDSDLRQVIQTVEAAWWRILTSNDTYDPDRLTFDRELLRKYYLSQGYADFRVISAIAELAPDRSGFYITFTVDEGDRYKFGKIKVVSAVKKVDPKALEALVTTKEDDWYNADAVEDTIKAISNELGNHGYAFVDVRPRVHRDKEKHILDVTYDIQEGPRVYVERINIKGNTRTLDKVIRRELQFAEGDAFNTSRIEESRRRLKNLGYFKDTDISNVPGSQPDTTIVNVEVTEQPTGEISLGAGYSTAEGVIGDFGVREKNFLGSGQDISLRFGLSFVTQEVDASYTVPYFMDTNITAGVDAFHARHDYLEESSYKQLTTGGTLRGAYNIVDYLNQQLHYTLRQDEIGDVQPGAAVAITNEAGTATTSLVGQGLSYDRRDNALDPSSGYVVTYGNDFAGLGGGVHYLRQRVTAAYYYPLGGQWDISASAEGGIMNPIGGHTIRVVDHFFLGGDNFPGFRAAGVGPRDTASGDALGGLAYAVGDIELTFPLGLPKEFGIVGKAFNYVGTLTDAGTLPGEPASAIETSARPRASAGVGIAWRSPFGPIRVDIAHPYMKESYDVNELFRFSFGTKF
jgi:outer membrane protein insertion porin family